MKPVIFKPRIHTSSSQEALLDLFLAHLAGDENRPESPFVPEKVVVQSFGMAKWLRLAIARRAGVCANIDFPFPVSFAREICRDIFGEDDLSKRKGFRDSSMLWHIFQELPRCVKEDKIGVFAPLGNYLKGELPELRRYELAQKIAEVFDNYLFARPDWINAWDNDEPVVTGGSARDAAWQKALWLRICKSLKGTVDEGLMHPASVFAGVEAEMKKLRERGELAAKLPSRVAVFGISYLPPVLSEFFLTLGLYTQVDFYLYSPADGAFWGNIGLRRPAGLLLREPTFPVSNDRFPDTVHPLLDQCGIMGRQYLNTMLSAEQGVHTVIEAEPSPDDTSMLGLLKASVRSGMPQGGKTAVAADDVSIAVHAVHTPMREMEVVRDQILDAFNKDEALTPDQVLVLVPDVEKYTPYIDAVFGGASDPRVQYTVADRVYRQQSTLLQGFLQLLDESEGRFTASAMLGLLEYPALRRTFGIAKEELEDVARLLETASIRWGRDAADRERAGVPAFDNNSWQKGLDRVLLGYAAGGDVPMVTGLQPLETADADLAGRVASFFYTVTGRLGMLRDAQGDTAFWQQQLQALAGACFTPDDDEIGELNELISILQELEKVHREEGITEKCGLDVMRAHLGKNLDTCSTAHGFIDGGITFCSFKPMRSIPFRMVVMAGMGIREFPRKTGSTGFDLAEAEPRQGDRSVRDDDRYLFLEMLLSARNRLLITYQGRSPLDDTEVAPSVVVTELLDVLDTMFVPPAGVKAASMGEYLKLQHHLTACHADYFDPGKPRYISFNRAYAAPSQLLGRGTVDLDGIAGRPGLSAAGLERIEVTPDELARFWQHPARHYVRNCLNADLVRGEGGAEDAEPFTIEGLTKYALGSDFVTALLAGTEPDIDAAIGSDSIPPGETGRQMVYELAAQARDFAAGLQQFSGVDILKQSISYSLEDEAVQSVLCSGDIDYYDGSGVLLHRFSGIKGKDKIKAWVYHVLLNYAGADLPEKSRLTLVYGTGTSSNTCKFWPMPQDEAEKHLIALLKWYRAGQLAPVPFTPDTSLAYAKRVRILQEQGADEAGIRRAAKQSAADAYENSFAAFPESADPYFAQCFMARIPADTDEYDAVARQVCLPIELYSGKKKPEAGK